jgi:hypothetical protein
VVRCGSVEQDLVIVLMRTLTNIPHKFDLKGFRVDDAFLEFDEITQRWSLLGKGDIKNYEGEIEKFFEWIIPYVDGYPGDFIGYSRYEEDLKPTLIYLPETKND